MATCYGARAVVAESKLLQSTRQATSTVVAGADEQPCAGEFLVRCVLPLQQITVKVAAIEQQATFRAVLPDGQTIGIELGADVNLSDKEAAVRSSDVATALLNWIIDQVIRGKKARGFLVNQSSAETPLLLSLFDARVLHIVRRGYSAEDTPGERFDVWVIDYGAYIDLMHTKNEPQGLLPLDGDATGDEGAWVDVPPQDLRAIRRAVLDLDEFRRLRGP